ncbi:MAG: PAS-domain containing protein [Xanthobacteraceae bacterium]
MPETIRTSAGCAHPRQGDFLAASTLAARLPAACFSAIPVALWPAPASAKEPALGAVQEFASAFYRTMDLRELAILGPMLGLVLFAVITAILLVRSRARSARLEYVARGEINALRDRLDRANALILSEQQVLVDWPAASEQPNIEGDPAILGVGEPHRVLAFGSWLDAAKAKEMVRAVEALRTHGAAFAMTLTTRRGQPIEALGRVIAGRAVLRLKDAGAVRRDLAQLAERHEKALTELASLRTLAETLPSPVWTRDAVGRLTFVNSAYAHAVEAPDAAHAIERNLELLDSAARETIAQARNNGRAYSGRLPAIVAGSRRSFDVLDVPTESGSAGIGIDATEAETMRSALARLVDAHRRTLDQLPIGVAMFDARQRLSFYNAAYRALWEFEAGYLDQCPSDSTIIDALRLASRLPEQQNFREWKAQLHEAYRAIEAREQIWHLPDGRTLRVVTTPNPDGGVTYLFHDVTERIDLERRYEELIRVQRETLDNLAEGVAVFASDGRLRLHNSAFVKMWELSPQALSERPHIEKITGLCRPLHGDDPTWQSLREVVTAIDSRKTISGRLERRDGSVVDCTTVPLPDGATLVTFHDVTDSVNVERALRERNEALVDADRIKIDFVHHVSYELRSPLTNIIGFVHLLADPATGPLGAKQREYLEYITVSSDTLLALINNILDLATIDAGRMQLNLGPVEIRETMQAAAEGVQDRLVSAGLTLDILAPADIGSFVADGRRLRQILFNLLANAVCFSPAGATITISAERRAGAVAFTVADKGSGIPPEVLEKVFNWFETHAHGSHHRGPGIGLSLVRSFVELHGGTVTIASTVGEGTTVTCAFPIKAVAARPAA